MWVFVTHLITHIITNISLISGLTKESLDHLISGILIGLWLIWQLHVTKGNFRQAILTLAGVKPRPWYIYRYHSLLGRTAVDIGDIAIDSDGGEPLEEEQTKLLPDPKPPGVPALLVEGGDDQAAHPQVVGQEDGDVAVAYDVGVVHLGDQEP